jgi:hypothetical protein
MTAVPQTSRPGVSPRLAGQQRVLRGLYWQEWFAHGSGLLMVFSAWLIGQWVLMIFFHPAWVLIGGSLVGLWLGAVFAGADAQELAEEFALALPPQRGERYRVRLVVSLSVLVLLVGTSLLAIRLDWPQALWGTVVETGFTEPWVWDKAADEAPTLYYALAAACPLAAYGVAFGMASLASARDQVAGAGLFGALYTAAGVLVGQSIESWIWQRRPHETHGLYSCAVLTGLAVLYLVVGYFGYRRKDGIARPRGTYGPEYRFGLALAGALLLLMVLVPVVLAYVSQW